MKKLIKYSIKEITGGQDLKPNHRAIFLWWLLSLVGLVVFAECLSVCYIAVGMFVVSSYFLTKYVPTPKDNSPEL